VRKKSGESERGASSLGKKKRNKTKHFIIFFSPRARSLYIKETAREKREQEEE
jgi:hypothetical protein